MVAVLALCIMAISLCAKYLAINHLHYLRFSLYAGRKHSATKSSQGNRPPTFARWKLQTTSSAPFAQQASNKSAEKQHQNDDNRLIFMTGASSNHFESIVLTAYQMRSLLPHARFIVWDFGLQAAEARSVKQWYRTEYKLYPFADYPEWININSEHRGHVSYFITGSTDLN
jgi:hypothetical protein